ncbi:MAG: hypothetical protein JXB47_05195 [Anaerolineae bacterium]|nr:hypothetical protein [Anaerolineae bacterium]
MLRLIGDAMENVPFLARVRRNHALEHATVHMLARRVPRLRVAGYSINLGFFMIGAVETAQLEAAADEALLRLRRGESRWAVHPNCGTSLLTSGLMVTLATLLAGQFTHRLEQASARLPAAVLFSMAALLLARPLGINLQRDVTTEAAMGGLRITGVRRMITTPFTVHWVGTELP